MILKNNSNANSIKITNKKQNEQNKIKGRTRAHDQITLFNKERQERSVAKVKHGRAKCQGLRNAYDGMCTFIPCNTAPHVHGSSLI